MSHGTQRCLFSEGEYHDSVKSSHISIHGARRVERTDKNEGISPVFRFGTLLWLRIRMDPLSTLGSPLSGLYGSCMEYVQKSSFNDFSGKLSLPEPAETFRMPLNTTLEDDLGFNIEMCMFECTCCKLACRNRVFT